MCNENDNDSMCSNDINDDINVININDNDNDNWWLLINNGNNDVM